MILDTSCIIAVLAREPEAGAFIDCISRNVCRISAATFVELFLALSSRHPKKMPYADNLIRDASIIIEPVTVDQARIARQAFLDFGKGRHRAGLNYGDCFAYALAKDMGEPLLFKGDDFTQTDIEAAA